VGGTGSGVSAGPTANARPASGGISGFPEPVSGGGTGYLPRPGAPGTIRGHFRFNPKTGNWEESTATYDGAGRQTNRIDRTDHGYPDVHPNPHQHIITYSPKFPDGLDSGPLPYP